ncbi:MAG: hypothetical protein HYW24_04265 [Candidatus Aenigmarchaeota archaeon]|nr:hypothetical protein [Candidatus Aenigmarchaeota archaeon]
MAVTISKKEYQIVTEEKHVKMLGKAIESLDGVCETYEPFKVFPLIDFYLSRARKASELLGKCKKGADNGHGKEIMQCLPYETLKELHDNAETAKSGNVQMVFYNLGIANEETQIQSNTTVALMGVGNISDRILIQKPRLSNYLD